MAALASVSFKSEFAVDMTCQNCVGAVADVLRDVPGIERYDIDLDKKRVTITGRTPPSHLFSALKSTDRQVIVRGASSSDPSSSSAAVAILESPLELPKSLITTTSPLLAGLSDRPLPGMNEEEHTQKVFGICRFVQIAPRSILMDLTVRLPPPSRVGLPLSSRSYEVYISSAGNMVSPPETTGKPFMRLGSIQPDQDGYGDLFKEVDGELWEWVGRGCVVEAAQGGAQSTNAKMNGTTSSLGRLFAGVVARSAGAWGNDKTVCACSGRTMWEEGREMEQKSML